MEAGFGIISQTFALQSLQNLLSSANVTNILTVSPQTILVPLSYKIVNLVPFDKPVYACPPVSLFILLTYCALKRVGRNIRRPYLCPDPILLRRGTYPSSHLHDVSMSSSRR